MKNKFGYNIKHNKVFNADKTFVTEVAFRAFAAPQLSRQLCLTLRVDKAANAG